MDPRVTNMESRDEDRSERAPTLQWLPWVLGSALLATVVVAASQLAEEREFARLVERAEPGWLLVALLLQAATYLAQGEVFRGAPETAGWHLPRKWLYQLSLTKLFVDQALPSAGLSSTLVIVKALVHRGVPRAAAAACAMVNMASYYAAYVATLLVALGITSILRETSLVLVSVSVLFIAFAIAMTVGIVALAGRRARPGNIFTRLPVIKGVVKFLEDADARTVRKPSVLSFATAWQIAIFLLDAATLWACIRSLGATAPADAVFASFMISSLVRTMSVVPGGLGTYEAASVLTLRLAGISLSVALSATLIFRGLTFWIPMLPGLWSSRRIMKPPP
jgi:Mg2+-importing ATPase